MKKSVDVGKEKEKIELEDDARALVLVIQDLIAAITKFTIVLGK